MGIVAKLFHPPRYEMHSATRIQDPGFRIHRTWTLEIRGWVLRSRCILHPASCILHPASCISAVQNKSTGDVAHLKTQGLRVGFRPFQGEVPFNQLMLFKARATATGHDSGSIQRQRQKAASGNSASHQRPRRGQHNAEPRSGDRWIARGVNPGSGVRFPVTPA